MSQTTKTPVPLEGTQLFQKPVQPRCPWYRHALPGTWTLHSTIHAISPTGGSAHISTCDGREYCQSLVDRFPHTRSGECMGWDLDSSDHFYDEPYSVVGTKRLYPYQH